MRKAQPLSVRRESTAPERFRAFVLSILALLGLLLAAVGIAGVTYRSVIDRTRDFAVRLALGSRAGGVIRLVLVESLRDVAIGAGCGRRWRGLARPAGARLRERRAGRCDDDAIAVAIIAATGLAAAFVPALRVSASSRRKCCAAKRGGGARIGASPAPGQSAGG